MAIKKKVIKKRKPAAITGAGIKAVKEVAKQAAKAGKRMSYKGKMTKTAKDIKLIKALTDPADKAAIKAAKSSQNIKKIKAKADSKELKRGIKSGRKDAGKAKADLKAKNKVIDAKNKVRSDKMARTSKQDKLKAKLKSAQAARKVDDGTKLPNLVMQRKSPSTGIKVKVDAPKLKPVTKSNIKKTVAKTPVVKKVVKKKMSAAKKAGVGGAVAAAAIIATKKKKSKPVSKEAIDNSSRNSNAKKGGDLKSNGKSVPRSGANAKIKPVGKAPKKSGSLSSASSKAFSNPKIKKKFPKGVPSKLKASALDKARKYAQKHKDSNIPWEKLLESITMLMSSHILSRGISKRYD